MVLGWTPGGDAPFLVEASTTEGNVNPQVTTLARIVHSGFLFRRVPEISVLIRVGESATFGAYHVWGEHRECRLAVVG